ncbi:MAG: helix-turn-helix domain-containing protein [Candidatus Thiodiazotropha endolucinida]|uniref:Helix-turn-helix domain-containing protein n=1 Tax=Candidatus Thiodiazotropha taylori TaxID=2792791 RepID=A0A9E4NP11_9GAMM|nr:helix-turn-helix domain-containing protein [Candidatus Thiodiazotropha taylori]MCW4238429.1 helix-turn-helix domain-containing protein [Candidatus Thiodiazotropha endolucinida]
MRSLQIDDCEPIDNYKLLNTSDAAELLGITTRKLEQMRQHGNGPKFIKLSPKCVRYRIKELVDFQNINLRQSTIDT